MTGVLFTDHRPAFNTIVSYRLFIKLNGWTLNLLTGSPQTVQIGPTMFVPILGSVVS